MGIIRWDPDFFWEGIRFKLDAKMLLVVFLLKGFAPLRLVREVWFGN